MTGDAHARALLAKRFRVQGEACRHLGSAMYAELMERAARDCEAGGPFLDVLAGHEDDPGPNAIALRVFGGVHRAALAGRAPDVAAHFPSTGGDGDVGGAWDALRAYVRDHGEELRPFLDQPPQTNEVGRSAALASGFLTAAARWPGLPLRLLEVGSSAGLNLRWDRYRYDVPGRPWGDASSPLSFPGDWFATGWPAWPPAGDVHVEERRGCDIAPVDPTTDEGRLTLLSYVWPDQSERLARLTAAIEVARRVPATVEQADAAEWIEGRLAEPAAAAGGGRLTVVFHSIFVQYLSEATHRRLVAAIEEAGRRASEGAPLAWVRLEPVPHQRSAGVFATLWPGGEERMVATAGFHGPPVRVT